MRIPDYTLLHEPNSVVFQSWTGQQDFNIQRWHVKGLLCDILKPGLSYLYDLLIDLYFGDGLSLAATPDPHFRISFFVSAEREYVSGVSYLLPTVLTDGQKNRLTVRMMLFQGEGGVNFKDVLVVAMEMASI